jgi:hypothetical protein
MIPLICGLCGSDFKQKNSISMTFIIDRSSGGNYYSTDVDGHLNYRGEFVLEGRSPVSYDSENGPYCKSCGHEIEYGYALRVACLDPIEEILLNIDADSEVIKMIHHYRIEHGGEIIKDVRSFVRDIEDEHLKKCDQELKEFGEKILSNFI